jgi:hypothetical protein
MLPTERVLPVRDASLTGISNLHADYLFQILKHLEVLTIRNFEPLEKPNFRNFEPLRKANFRTFEPFGTTTIRNNEIGIMHLFLTQLRIKHLFLTTSRIMHLFLLRNNTPLHRTQHLQL